MMMFSIVENTIDSTALKNKMQNKKAGAFVCFEGQVRNHNNNRDVIGLEYEIYEPLTIKEAKKIIFEAQNQFEVFQIMGVHRRGFIKMGETAIWIGVIAAHRDAAFKACRYVIDEIKKRLPVWKKEHYTTKKACWIRN